MHLNSFIFLVTLSQRSIVEMGGGRVVRWCWVNFKCRGVLLIWIRVGQGPTTLEVGAGGGCLDIFSLIYHFSFLSPSLWETAWYRLKYCLKGPLSPKQPTNQPTIVEMIGFIVSWDCFITLKCLSIGTPKAINFPFVWNEKVIFFRCPSMQAHCNEAGIYLDYGTPENNEFSIWNKWKIYYF